MTIALTLITATILIMSACGDSDKSSNPVITKDFKTGDPSEYDVESSSPITVRDSISGFDFEFPEGGYGSLTVAPITSGPTAPYAGEGFSISYSGANRVMVHIPKEDAYCVLLMGYGTSYGSRDDRDEDDWRALAETGSTDDEAVFELLLPVISLTGRQSTSAADHDGFTYHWISKIPSGSSDAVKLEAIKTQANEFIWHYLDSLPASIKTAAISEVNSRLTPTFYADDNYYIGFTRRIVVGNSTTPMIGLIPGASANTIAHEVGHYMNHVLVGDAVYLQIENSAPDNHGVGDSHYLRTTIAEDMAYFAQYFLIGNVNSADVTEPGLFLRGKDPELTDYPSLEGFAACLLARLNSTATTIRDVENTSVQRDFPVVGAGFPDLFGIIDRGAVNVDQLRDHVKEYLASTGQAAKYPVVLERVGWHYLAKAKIVNENGDPVVNADVKCVCKVGSTEYFTRTENGYTDNQGQTSYIEVFPDSSYLRVEYNGASHDIQIYIDPDGPTHVALDLGELEVSTFDLSQFVYFHIGGCVNAKLLQHQEGHDDTEYWTDLYFNAGSYIKGSFTGNVFTAVWDTAIYANPVNDSGRAEIEINVQSQSLVGVQTDWIDPASGDATKREYSLQVAAIPTIKWTDLDMTFEITGENTCLFLNGFSYRTYNDPGYYWVEMTDYECNEESFIRVTVYAY